MRVMFTVLRDQARKQGGGVHGVWTPPENYEAYIKFLIFDSK